MMTGKLYKHSNCIDVAFCPERIEELGSSFVCTGYWWRVGNNTTPKLLQLDTIAIANMDVDQWKIYEE